ncbi:HD domain-containing protein [Paenibacillus thalictri]|uniref:HD domain-containing protein n=1 Tax=Paenibacillus thalictri TaxID=2527873 RepID=A0A4Q9DQF4_9BACL|nr:HD domain-containing protein [Paenibacillus thalictri]TBL78666.1 HD domain-containing protein [Paenibacillus thalictri]
MFLHQTLALGHVTEPLYKLRVELHPLEAELLASPSLRRLKHLHHYGASALCTPVTHSRLEHTIGVWALTARFFPDEPELRVAALLHDIGHLPFSHAAEKPLGLNHHRFTEERIAGGDISPILRKYGFDPQRLIALLEQDTPLTGKRPQIGFDHLDSFLRDTEAAGTCRLAPSLIIGRLTAGSNGIETDEETAGVIMDAVLADHSQFLSAPMMAMDALLSKAVLLHAEAHPDWTRQLPGMTDFELLYVLQTSQVEQVRQLAHLLIWEPHRIRTSKEPFEGSIRVMPHKVYDNQPFVGGLAASDILPGAAGALESLRKLVSAHYIGWDPLPFA